MSILEKAHKHNEIPYTYMDLKREISRLKTRYKFISVENIGTSVEQRELYVLKLGKGKRKLFICGGTHACEWITVPILMKWIDEVSEIYQSKRRLSRKSISQLLEKTTLYILPMVNPDGIELQIKGLSPDHQNYKNLLKWNNYNQDFSKWKGNIRGVDLNRNYDAKWEEAQEIAKDLGITGPWLELYGGEYAESEPETKAIVNYTKEQDFEMVLSYHTQGQVIYWTFDQIHIPGAQLIGDALAKASGYKLDIPENSASYAGYKDWFIQEFKRPGYTIECGLGENPLPLNQFDDIYRENFQLLLVAAWKVAERSRKR